MKILGIIQARMSSSRLPGKVLKPLGDKPMIVYQYERTCLAKLLDEVVVATSEDSSDDELAKILGTNSINYFRGSLDNVLDRFYQIAKKSEADIVVRLTGDCPFSDPEVIDQVIQYHKDQGGEYTSNCRPPTFPDGLDVEMFSFDALETAWKNSTTVREKEHVSPYIVANYEKNNYEFEKNLSHYRWTIDEPEDYEFATKVFNQISEKGLVADFKNIRDIVESNEELMNLNHHFERNAGSKNQK